MIQTKPFFLDLSMILQLPSPFPLAMSFSCLVLLVCTLESEMLVHENLSSLSFILAGNIDLFIGISLQLISLLLLGWIRQSAYGMCGAVVKS